jgi:hypothetical protein
MKKIEPDETNYVPGSISFADGFMGPPLGSDRNKQMGVDTVRARQIVKSLLKDKRSIERAELGLDGDWRENSTTIYDGKFHKYDSWGGSCWAKPTLIVFFNDGPNEMYRCFK